MTFMPRKVRSRTLPLIVLAHGEIHGNVASDEEAHVFSELIEQGYAVIAPDYRGSSGYGADYWRRIDYGGLEVEDVNFQEFQKLLTALQTSGKSFRYRIYTNAPGGHQFNRLDTNFARESRAEIWQFLAGYLKPARKSQ